MLFYAVGESELIRPGKAGKPSAGGPASADDHDGGNRRTARDGHDDPEGDVHRVAGGGLGGVGSYYFFLL